ncbi:unnamed protein product [Porites evermanni]|uniref:EGF-like domain-containing protein n=1 Tax=Porites evermanni TaxID=104178 RepID=A0ABN8PRM9_9CNID|nr:unnamed protein product [Porites evermanni]
MMNQRFSLGLGLLMMFLTVFSSGFAIEPHCFNVTKTVQIVYRDAQNPVSLTFDWEERQIEGTLGVIFGVVMDRAGKCIVERALTITLATTAKQCPPFTEYDLESWCHNETVSSLKKTNGSLELTVQFSVKSMLKYLNNVTVNNTVLFSSSLQYNYLSTNHSASDRTIQVHISEGQEERENASGGIWNPCQSSPCWNNATCQGMEGWRYNCTCMEGFSGNNCEQGGNPTPEVHPSEAQIRGKDIPSHVIAIIVISSIALILSVIALLYWRRNAIYRRLIRKETQGPELFGV